MPADQDADARAVVAGKLMDACMECSQHVLPLLSPFPCMFPCMECSQTVLPLPDLSLSHSLADTFYFSNS